MLCNCSRLMISEAYLQACFERSARSSSDSSSLRDTISMRKAFLADNRFISSPDLNNVNRPFHAFNYV